MADTNIKTLQTRIALKYDTYANWTDEAKGANLVLLKGELGICEIPSGNAQATTAPTVLFKVGDGTNPFKSLKWASALAADVYGWAKADTVVFDEADTKLKFKNGEEVVHDIDLSYFAEAAEVAAHGDRLTDIEAALGLDGGTSDESVSKQIAAIVEQLGVINGADTVEGSIAKALKDAKAYTDEVVGVKAEGENAATGLRKEIADAEAAAVAAANGYTDGKVAELEAKDAELVAEDARIAGLVAAEVTARENADKAITDVIGEGFEATETGTVAAKVKAAQDAADAAQADVDALTAADGAVTKNVADIAELKQDLTDEVKAREDGDKALDERLVKVETFFEGAYAEDGKPLNEALDTLVEIQEFLDGDGEAAGNLIDRIAQNETDIEALQITLAEGGDFEKRVAAVEAKAGENENNIKSLQDLTAGDYGDGTIKDAIDAAMTQANAGVDAAGKAQSDVDALKLVVDNEETGLAKAYDAAVDAQTRVEAVEAFQASAENDIAALKEIVSAEGGNSNAQLRADIEELQGIVKTGADANEALGLEIDDIAALVNNEATGLAATKAVADAAKELAEDNESKIAAIEDDYLKAADAYIFNCGSATEVVHVAPAN